MINPSLPNELLALVYAVFVVVFIVIVVKTLPPKGVTEKYPRILLVKSVFPFFNSWKKDVEPEDLETVERFGKYVFIFIVVSLGCQLLAELIFRIQIARIFQLGE